MTVSKLAPEYFAESRVKFISFIETQRSLDINLIILYAFVDWLLITSNKNAYHILLFYMGYEIIINEKNSMES